MARDWKNLLTTIAGGMQAADDYQQQKIQNKSQSIGNLITATNDVDTFQDVIKTIKQYDTDWDDLGYDEEGDVLLQLATNKYDIMKKGQMAYDKLVEMNMNITGQESFDAAKNKVLDDDWAVINQDMRELYVLQSHLDNALKLGMRFKGGDEIAPEALKVVVSQYQGMYHNKHILLAQSGVFDIPDEDIQAFDENFGVALMTYSPADFSKMMGGHQRKLESLYQRNEGLTNTYYNLWKNAEASGEKSGPAVEGLPEYETGETVTSSEYKKRYDEYHEQTQKVNERHKQFYKSYISDNPRFIKGFKEEDEFNLDANVSSLVSTQGKQVKPIYDENGNLTKISVIKKDEEEQKTEIIDEKAIKKGDFELKEINGVWHQLNTITNEYEKIPNENIESIVINGKTQNVPVIKSKKGDITHIWVKNRWKKASIPKPKKEKPVKSPRLSGPAGRDIAKFFDFPPVYQPGEYEQLQEERILKPEDLFKGRPLKTLHDNLLKYIIDKSK